MRQKAEASRLLWILKLFDGGWVGQRQRERPRDETEQR